VDRGYAMFVTLQFLISGLGLYLLPVYSGLLGPTGMYLSIAALDMAGIALAVYLPGRAVAATGAPGQGTELHVLLAAATLLGAFGFLVFEAANTAQFTYWSASVFRSTSATSKWAQRCCSHRLPAFLALSPSCCWASGSDAWPGWRVASPSP
jgi:hypothetical protein